MHRVLVVDDNDSVRDGIVAVLKSAGYAAQGVGNGREALRVLRNGFHACLIVLDMMMPVMDGWTFRFEQRQDATLAQIPVVILTAVVNPAHEAKRVGAIAGLHKPLDMDILLSLVETRCGQQRP